MNTNTTTNKKTDRKAYLKRKKQEHRRNNRTVTLSFPNALAKQMEKEAREYNLTLPSYIKQSVRAYRQKYYLVPNAAEVQRIELLLRNFGNNINQIARKTNQQDIDAKVALSQVYTVLQRVGQELNDLFRSPRDLSEYTKQALEENPRYVSPLLSVLSTHIKELCS